MYLCIIYTSRHEYSLCQKKQDHYKHECCWVLALSYCALRTSSTRKSLHPYVAFFNGADTTGVELDTPGVSCDHVCSALIFFTQAVTSAVNVQLVKKFSETSVLKFSTRNCTFGPSKQRTWLEMPRNLFSFLSPVFLITSPSNSWHDVCYFAAPYEGNIWVWGSERGWKALYTSL